MAGGHASYLRSGLSSVQPGGYYNTDVTSYIYKPDTSRGYSTDVWERDLEGRLTWQATPKDKINFPYVRAANCHPGRRMLKLGFQVQF